MECGYPKKAVYVEFSHIRKLKKKKKIKSLDGWTFKVKYPFYVGLQISEHLVFGVVR